MSERDETAAEREGLLRRTSEVLGSVEYRRVETPDYSVWHLEAADGADYAFAVWVYDNGEPEISARLGDSSEDCFFWGRHFELPGHSSVESRNLVFLEILERVVTCATRITQTKGWLFWGFRCDAQVGERWVSLGGHSAARWIPVRDTGQKETVYFSPAVRRRAGAVEQEDEADER
jgi:hypothetical protein